jgi:hypothetical protein
MDHLLSRVSASYENDLKGVNGKSDSTRKCVYCAGSCRALLAYRNSATGDDGFDDLQRTLDHGAIHV